MILNSYVFTSINVSYLPVTWCLCCTCRSKPVNTNVSLHRCCNITNFWNRVLQKLIAPQIVKKLRARCRTRNLIIVLMSPLVPVLNQTNPFQALQSYFVNSHFNNILPSTPRSSKWSLFSGLYIKSLLCFCSPPYVLVARKMVNKKTRGLGIHNKSQSHYFSIKFHSERYQLEFWPRGFFEVSSSTVRETKDERGKAYEFN